MLEHTKKPPTEPVELRVVGPAERKAEALAALAKFGFVLGQKEETSPWREAFSYKDEEVPGVVLAGARHREGLTQADLSAKTGIPRRHLSEMEHNKRPIGKANARKLAEALGIDPRRFRAV